MRQRKAQTIQEEATMPKKRQEQPRQSEDLHERLQGKEFLAGQELTSINPETRTVDCIFFTGIDVPRTDWWTGEKYILRFDPKGGDFSLLNNGAPILDSHSAWGGTADQKGVVEKAWQDGKDSKATVRFSKRPEVDGLWQDIQDRIVTKFSMGVTSLREEKIQENNMEVRLVKKWRPFELSVCPVPADFGTTTLAAEDGGMSTTEVKIEVKTNNQLGTQRPEGDKMPDQVTGTGAQDTNALSDTQLKAAHDVAQTAERARVMRITTVCEKLHLSHEFMTKHIGAGTSIELFNQCVVDEEFNNSIRFAGESRGHTTMSGVRLERDERDTRRELMSSALLGLMSPKDAKEDRQNQFIGLSMKQIAQESARLQLGMRGLPKDSVVIELAMQVTSDFAAVLETTSRKQMLNGYDYAQPSYRVWTKRTTTPDFKTMTRVRLTETPGFLKVPEGAQITIGTMTDSKESYALATYGRGLSFSRQMLINDDLGAFNDLIFQFGVQAARLENKTVYAILNNGHAAAMNMADGIPIFTDATHYNSKTGVIGNTALDTGFGAMKAQKGLDGVTVLNLNAKYLIVPAAKESTARSAVLVLGPNIKASDQNWFGGRLEVVPDAELDGTSTAMWYLAADPALAPGIEACFLQGQEGPQFIRKENENGILGIQFYGFEDFAAKCVDYRPLYKSSGA
jgi:phage major head subunit gpT-like protein